jgi:hypothetical protein
MTRPSDDVVTAAPQHCGDDDRHQTEQGSESLTGAEREPRVVDQMESQLPDDVDVTIVECSHRPHLRELVGHQGGDSRPSEQA